jgi:hypothetical protein
MGFNFKAANRKNDVETNPVLKMGIEISIRTNPGDNIITIETNDPCDFAFLSSSEYKAEIEVLRLPKKT